MSELGRGSVSLESFLCFFTGDTRNLWILKPEPGLFQDIGVGSYQGYQNPEIQHLFPIAFAAGDMAVRLSRYLV